MRTLRGFMPSARERDWELITAGQRVQVIKRGKGGGVLEFGTELITAADGSIAGLLGASPGASTAASAMLDLLRRCFPDRYAGWTPRLAEMMPQLARTARAGDAPTAPGGGEAPDADPDLRTEDPAVAGVGHEPGPEPRDAASRAAGRRPARPSLPRRRDTPVA